ncbi:MAG: DUF4838 domain-containing protein [Opitutales bacterium]|nr:DUF4838 domain-containing protein [Opitutales bacterium]
MLLKRSLLKILKRAAAAMSVFAVLAACAEAAPRRPHRNERGFRLLENGRVSLEVEIPENPSKAEIEAAEAIKKHLEKLAVKSDIKISRGAKFFGASKKIKISKFENIKEPSPQSPDFSAFNKNSVKIRPRRVEIKYSAHPLNAAGLFLKHVGIKFLAPNDVGTEYPEILNKTLPNALVEQTQPFASSSIYPAAKKSGEAEYYGLNGRNGYFENFSHNIQNIFDAETLKKNPEFAPKVGKYVPKKCLQPNFAHPRAAGLAAKKAAVFFAKNPQKKFFSLSLDDSLNHDERTPRNPAPDDVGREFANYSEAYFSFANSAAGIVKKIYPDKFLPALAYFTTEIPPSFKVEKNIVPMLTTDKSCYASIPYKFDDFELMRRWKDSGAALFACYSYIYGEPYYTPRGIEIFEAQAIKKMIELNCAFYFAEATPVWAYDAPKLYLIQEILNGSKEEPLKILHKFYRDFFKESAGPASEFFRLARESWGEANKSGKWLAMFQQECEAEVFPPQTLEKMDEALSRAEALAKSEKVKIRVSEIRKRFELTKAFCEFYQARKALQLAENPEPEETLRALAIFAEAKINFDIQNSAARENSAYPQHPYKEKAAYENSAASEVFAVLPKLDSGQKKRLAAILEKFSPVKMEDFLAAQKSGAEAKIICAEDFSQKKFNPQNADFAPLPGNIRARFQPSVGSLFGIVKNGGGQNVLRSKNVESSGIMKTAKAEKDKLYLAEFDCEYALSKTASAYAFLGFFDKTGKRLKSARIYLYTFDKPQSKKFSILLRAPQNAALAAISFNCEIFSGGDFADLKSLSLKQIQGRSP